ncbi:MAG: hypothetical protein HYV39_01525 [Candidatus Levybacteria bacterium]|nr:hypothetical protein [Candidatus Levybacteria bacterium]
MQQKKIIIAAALVLLLILFGLGYFLYSPRTSQSPQETPQDEEQQQEEVVIPTISPDNLGLTFVARNDKKAVKFAITEIKDIQAVDYEVSYLAEGNIPRGAIGHIEVKPTDQKIGTNYIDLGTCSSGKCKYDQGVTLVKLILKITKINGKIYSAEKTLEL